MKEVSWLKSRRFWLGVAFSVTLLGLFFWQVDLGETVDAFQAANYWWFVPAVAVYFVAVFFRTFRWHFLLQPFKAIPTRRLYPVVVIGYMANNLLPVRLGELVRSYYVAQRERVSGSAALATIIVERVFDGLVLILLAAFVWQFLPTSHLLRDLATSIGLPLELLLAIAIGPFVAVFVVFMGVAARPQLGARVAEALVRLLPSRVRAPVRNLALRFVEGLSTLRSPRRVGAMVLLTLPIWLCEALMYWLIAIGFGLDEAFHGLLLTTSTSNLATSVPSPGGVGPFEFVTKVTLESLGADASLAAAYAIALHVALLLPVTVLGLIFLWTSNISFSSMLRRGAEQAQALSAQPGPVKP